MPLKETFKSVQLRNGRTIREEDDDDDDEADAWLVPDAGAPESASARLATDHAWTVASSPEDTRTVPHEVKATFETALWWAGQ